MTYSYTEKKRIRKSFAKRANVLDVPFLLATQLESFTAFLQAAVPPAQRKNQGLQAAFSSIFPIVSHSGNARLEFVSFALAEPAFDVKECQQRGLTFASALRAKVRLIILDRDAPDTIKEVKEQEVYMGEIPLMTTTGSFVINGTERVIVSQLHRSPGVFFEHDRGKTHSSGKLLFSARVIPYRGSWLDFEFDPKDILFFRVDRRRKMPVTTLLKAIGLTPEQIPREFFDFDSFRIGKNGIEFSLVPERLRGEVARFDFNDKAGKTIVAKDKRITGKHIRELDAAAIKEILVPEDFLVGRVVAQNIIDTDTGEILANANDEVSEALLAKLIAAGVESLETLYINDLDRGSFISQTLRTDETISKQAARVAIYRMMRPGEPPTEEAVEILFNGLFYSDDRYDLSAVGRMKFNRRVSRQDVVEYKVMVKHVPSKREAIVKAIIDTAGGSPAAVELLLSELSYGTRAVAENLTFEDANALSAELKVLGVANVVRDQLTLSPRDIVEVIKILVELRNGRGDIDDIDHLGNRRVRSVGELAENQFRAGLVRVERAVKERLSQAESDNLMPHDLINAKPISAAVREFFGSSQLSQFMDQTNPLSEITHKRRLSALGPGGLSRERAGFEVRDVHTTHYGRICPIETPEGPNIGLISLLAYFARINDYGFIESPYRRVVDGYVIDEVRILNPGDTSYKVNDVIKRTEIEKANKALGKDKQLADFESHSDYLSAWEEDKYVVAQANIPLDEKGKITSELVNARQAGNFVLKTVADVQYMDVSPKQLVSVAASLIPFLENDDANRALMGSNMQRQAVPLLRADSPVVGTGMEKVTARDSGAVVICKRAGIVDSVDSERIIVRVDGGGVAEGQMSREVGADIYPLTKFKRSNQNTCINQKPIAYVGQRVVKGDVLADGPCTDAGELALGRNVLVAFMPWRGYNFEDAIVISEKMVKEDYYTSIHIEEFEIEARDTKLGPEEITRDIPNISESFLRNLDESGIIRIGATVKPGDILVGKVTPKGETQLTPEEKLLRAIFGEKAGDVKDASLYCPPGIEGVVVDAKVFSRKGADLDERSKIIQEEEVQRLERNLNDEKRILNDERSKRLFMMLGGRIVQADLHDEKTNKKLLGKGQEITRDILEKMRSRDLKRMRLDKKDPLLNEKLDEIEDMTSRQIAVLEKINEEKKAKLKKGDELPPGVIKLVKCYIAMKRKLSVGDKMAGRHGNKGVIARIVPEEDMPYLPDGTPVEIVLNPLGVPSRMNVGQILETHLGWAARALGVKFATPVFDGATEKDIKEQLAKAGLPSSGKIKLVDGMTGIAFEQPVTVGYIYMLKLSHLVDDKIHARSIGPYSLITQQPLGGKAQFGGQRFGEMEVWALEAYGAAYILQELLTAKSDDVYGRAKIYEAIVKGEATAEPGVPESFNVLIRELQSLCLDVELMKMKKATDEEEAPVDTALAAD